MPVHLLIILRLVLTYSFGRDGEVRTMAVRHIGVACIGIVPDLPLGEGSGSVLSGQGSVIPAV